MVTTVGCCVSSSPPDPGHHLLKNILTPPTPEGQRSFQDSLSLSIPTAHGRGWSRPRGERAQQR